MKRLIARRAFAKGLKGFAPAAALISCLLSSAASAATITWADAGSAFATPSNWEGDVAPGAGDIANFTSASPVLANVTVSQDILGLNFASTAGNYYITGTGTLTVGASGITTDATSPSIIQAPIALGAAQTWANNDSASSLQVNGGVNTEGYTLTMGGTANGSIGGSFTGTGNIVVASTGIWQFTNLSSTSGFTGTTTINTGSLYLNSSSDTLGSVTVASTSGTALLGVATNSPTIGNLTLGGAAGTTSNVYIASGSTLNVGGTLAFNAANAPSASQISGNGTLALTTNTTISVGYTTGSTTDLTIYTPISGTGDSLTKTGAGDLTLAGASTYTGNTTVTSGRLVVSNANGSATGTGNVLMESGTQLRGIGFIGGNVTLLSGSSIRTGVGTGVGALTFNGGLNLESGSVLDFNDGSLGNSKLEIGGGTFAGDGAADSITLNLYANGTFSAGTYTLIAYSGASSSTFNVNELTMGTEIAGYDYSIIDNVSQDKIQLVATAVPEPTTYAMIAGACALGLGFWHRRNKRQASALA